MEYNKKSVKRKLNLFSYMINKIKIINFKIKTNNTPIIINIKIFKNLKIFRIDLFFVSKKNSQ